MPFLITRRTYNAHRKRFTNNWAALTRYVPDAGASDADIPRDDFVAEVLRVAGGHGILFFVHGFRTTQAQHIARLRLIEDGLRTRGFRGAIVGVDWPSKGSVLSYSADREMAKKMGTVFVPEGVGPFLDHPSAPKVHVMAHSMGALVLLRGLSDPGAVHGPRDWQVDTLSLTAADVDADWLLRNVWGGMTCALRARRVVNYWSNRDKTLKLGENIVSGGRDRLGFVGLPAACPPEFEDVYCGAYYKAKLEKPDDGWATTHNWHFRDAIFYGDVAGLLAGTPKNAMGRAPMDNGDGQAFPA